MKKPYLTIANTIGKKMKVKPLSPQRKEWKIVNDKGQVLERISIKPPAQYFFSQSGSAVMEERGAYNKTLDFKSTQPLFDFLGFNQQDVAEMMEVDPSTLFRWKKEDKKLNKLLTKAILDMDKLIAKGIRIFGSEEHFSEWLHTVNYSLGDQRPFDLMKDPYGLELLDDALEAMSWGNVM